MFFSAMAVAAAIVGTIAAGVMLGIILAARIGNVDVSFERPVKQYCLDDCEWEV